jgi:hypothetical protein
MRAQSIRDRLGGEEHRISGDLGGESFHPKLQLPPQSAPIHILFILLMLSHTPVKKKTANSPDFPIPF